LLEKMEGEPLRGFPADPRKPGQLGDQFLDCAHRSERRGKWQRRYLTHFALQHLGSPALSLRYRSQHEITEELGIVILEYPGIDPHCADCATSIRRHLDHAAAGRGFNGSAGQFGLELLQPALHLLAELKELLKICHAIR
jgi:hypothetical protein